MLAGLYILQCIKRFECLVIAFQKIFMTKEKNTLVLVYFLLRYSQAIHKYDILSPFYDLLQVSVM